MTIRKQKTKATGKQTNESPATKRKNKIAQIAIMLEEMDPDEVKQLLVDKYGGVIIEAGNKRKLGHNYGDTASNSGNINYVVDSFGSASEFVQNMLDPKQMTISLDEIVIPKRLTPLPRRARHNPHSDWDAYVLMLNRPSIDDLPVIKTQADYFKIAMHNFEIFAQRLKRLGLKKPNGVKLKNHIRKNYHSIKEIAISARDPRLQKMVCFYSAVLAARMYFHSEAKEWLRLHGKRLKTCSIMIQYLIELDAFEVDYMADELFWPNVVTELDREIVKLPGKEAEYPIFDPELTYIIDFFHILGGAKVEVLIFKLFKRFGTYNSISPGKIGNSVRDSLINGIGAVVNDRRAIMESVRGLDILQGRMPEESKKKSS
jgi:hypothetical protein